MTQEQQRPSFDAKVLGLIARTEQYVCDKMSISTVADARESDLSQPWIDQAETRRGFLEDLVRFVDTGERGSILFPNEGDWYGQLDRVQGGEEFFKKVVIRLMIEGFFQPEGRFDRIRGLLLEV